MKVQYIAEDGIVFDTEVECKQHELLTTFGSDSRFVNAVADAVSHLVTEDDRGNEIIYFDGTADKTRVSVALAQNFENLRLMYEAMCDDQHTEKYKRPSKRRARK